MNDQLFQADSFFFSKSLKAFCNPSITSAETSNKAFAFGSSTLSTSSRTCSLSLINSSLMFAVCSSGFLLAVVFIIFVLRYNRSQSNLLPDQTMRNSVYRNKVVKTILLISRARLFLRRRDG